MAAKIKSTVCPLDQTAGKNAAAPTPVLLQLWRPSGLDTWCRIHYEPDPGTIYNRSDVDLVRVDFVIAWTGASGANPRLAVSPAYNLDGTAVAAVAATGSVAVDSIVFGDPLEFVVAADVLATLINASAATVVETLPGATGTGATRFYATKDVTNQATITVQSGESLNGAADGVFYVSNYTAGTQFVATDVGAGEWVIAVEGSPGTMAPLVIPVDVTTITQIGSTTNLVYTGTNPATGQTIVLYAEYYDLGGVRHARIRFASDDTDVIRLSLGSILCPAGASIYSVNLTQEDTDIESGAFSVGTIVGDDDGIFINKIDSNTDDALFQVDVTILGAGGGHTVLAGMVEVEGVRVLLCSASGIASNSNVTISQTWGSLAAEYDRVEFEFVSTAGTLIIRNSETISTASWVDSTRTVLNADDTTIVVRDMDIAGTTANLFLSGSVSQGDLNIYGIKAQKTVINEATTPTNDQAASGYFDIGAMRLPWGTEDADGTVKTFAASFAAAPQVTVTQSDASGGSDRIPTAESISTTGFTLTSWNTGSNTVSNIGETCSYFAIGLKP